RREAGASTSTRAFSRTSPATVARTSSGSATPASTLRSATATARLDPLDSCLATLVGEAGAGAATGSPAFSQTYVAKGGPVSSVLETRASTSPSATATALFNRRNS